MLTKVQRSNQRPMRIPRTPLSGARVCALERGRAPCHPVGLGLEFTLHSVVGIDMAISDPKGYFVKYVILFPDYCTQVHTHVLRGVHTLLYTDQDCTL